MHLNCHTACLRLAVNYFHKKHHHKIQMKYKMQNTGVILLIQSIYASVYYNCTALSIYYIFIRKSPFCKALFLIFKNQNQAITKLETFLISSEDKVCDG